MAYRAHGLTALRRPAPFYPLQRVYHPALTFRSRDLRPTAENVSSEGSLPGGGLYKAPMSTNREWVNWAIGRIEADFHRSADTHLIPLPVPALPDIAIYLKDESSHPTGSLKHRLARSLFLYGLCNGWICERTAIVEASSGSTAVSEAYFARMLGLRFIAVVPR